MVEPTPHPECSPHRSSAPCGQQRILPSPARGNSTPFSFFFHPSASQPLQSIPIPVGKEPCQTTMAFASSHTPFPLRKASRLINRFSHHSQTFQSPICSARTPITPPRSDTLPRNPNFFLNTSLSRIPAKTFPPDIDQLLDAVSDSDRFLPIWNDKPLIVNSVHPDDNNPSQIDSVAPVLWTPARLRSWLIEMRQIQSPSEISPLAVTLAQSNSITPPINYFAVDVSHSQTPPTVANQSISSLRTLLPLLETETEAALIAHAKALISWHNSANYCSRCGQLTHVTQGGAARNCPNQACNTRNIYPRVMPSVLVLVLRDGGDEVLLGRKSSWPSNRFSVLAGFAEIFESLEQTVAREVFEETGVIVDQSTITYHSSQPWPSLPQASLMSGFRAYVTSASNAKITVDRDELEDARWFRKDWLREHLVGTNLDGSASTSISIPGHTSLARRLILEWLHEAD